MVNSVYSPQNVPSVEVTWDREELKVIYSLSDPLETCSRGRVTPQTRHMAKAQFIQKHLTKFKDVSLKDICLCLDMMRMNRNKQKFSWTYIPKDYLQNKPEDESESSYSLRSAHRGRVSYKRFYDTKMSKYYKNRARKRKNSVHSMQSNPKRRRANHSVNRSANHSNSVNAVNTLNTLNTVNAVNAQCNTSCNTSCNTPCTAPNGANRSTTISEREIQEIRRKIATIKAATRERNRILKEAQQIGMALPDFEAMPNGPNRSSYGTVSTVSSPICSSSTDSTDSVQSLQSNQDSKVYCVCRQPDDGSQFMICCDLCEEWYHPSCIGMSSQQLRVAEAGEFLCPLCDAISKKSKFITATSKQVIAVNPVVKSVPTQMATNPKVKPKEPLSVKPKRKRGRPRKKPKHNKMDKLQQGTPHGQLPQSSQSNQSSQSAHSQRIYPQQRASSNHRQSSSDLVIIPAVNGDIYVEDPTKEYCICRRPFDGEQPMICCDRCEEWYHPSCIGMSERELKEAEAGKFQCHFCSNTIHTKQSPIKKVKNEVNERNQIPEGICHSNHREIEVKENIENNQDSVAIKAEPEISGISGNQIFEHNHQQIKDEQPEVANERYESIINSMQTQLDEEKKHNLELQRQIEALKAENQRLRESASAASKSESELKVPSELKLHHKSNGNTVASNALNSATLSICL